MTWKFLKVSNAKLSKRLFPAAADVYSVYGQLLIFNHFNKFSVINCNTNKFITLREVK